MARTDYDMGRDVGVAATHTDVEVRRGRIQGGPVWGGFAVGFGLWVLFELLLVAFDLSGVDAAVGSVDTAAWWWSGIAVVVAFFVGGFVSGSASVHRSVDTGVLNGAAVWGIAVTATVLLSAFGLGATLGAAGDVFSFGQATQGATQGGAQVGSEALGDVQDAAGWAALFMALTLAAAAVGGAIGIKTWPRDRHHAGDTTAAGRTS